MTAQNRESNQRETTHGVFSGYAPDKDFPMGAYMTFAAVYNLGLGACMWRLDRKGRLPVRLSIGDTLLLGVATHKLSRVATRDWVTSPLRAPFVRYQKPAPGGEVEEEARGRGLRQAIGQLVSCPFCMGPWIAGGLMLGLVTRPRITRAIMGIFAAVTASDFLHRSYGLLESRRRAIDSTVEELEEIGAAGAREGSDSGAGGDVSDMDPGIEDAEILEEQTR